MHFNLIKKKIIPCLPLRIFTYVFLLVSLLFFLSQNDLFCSDVIPSLKSSENDIKKQLQSQYQQLLMEKGICDDQGKEIEGRLGKLIQEA